jgi:hypothetical protein
VTWALLVLMLVLELELVLAPMLAACPALPIPAPL